MSRTAGTENNMNEIFLARMKAYLKDEYEAYVHTLGEAAFRGLRVNTAKIDVEHFHNLKICTCQPSTICEQSFYLPPDVHGLGNHPAHLGGLCYIQEPSAASAVEILDVKKGDWVLDLCAAPGGKSTQIAAELADTGCLISNEIDAKRALILLSNMERLGFRECLITNAHPKALCETCKGWFDKVLVDAPCSGEGMFKKHSKAMEDWSITHVEACANRQLQILHCAYETLKEDGILVYSTCTYAIEENEAVIWHFLNLHPDMELIDAGVRFGRVGIPYKNLDITKVRRIFPMDQGEGHFVAKLKRRSAACIEKKKEYKNEVLPRCAMDFLASQIHQIPAYHILVQDKVYIKQTPFLKLKNIHILRQGTLCGVVMKNRMEPHQHFYTTNLHKQYFTQVYDMRDEECYAYVKGHPLSVSGYKGYTALTWKHYVLAYGKGDGTVLKNKYPKGLRVKGKD